MHGDKNPRLGHGMMCHCVLDYGANSRIRRGQRDDAQRTFRFRAGLEKYFARADKIEFGFKAAGSSVEMGGGSQLAVHEPGRAYSVEVAACRPL